MRLGADVDALERLAADLARRGGALSALRDELSAIERATVWTGTDADRFRTEWRRALGPAVAATAAALSEAAAVARRQAAAQRSASEASGGAGTGRGAAEVLEAPPRRVRIVTVSVQGGAELVGGATAELRIEELGHGRIRVTEVGGLTAGAGISAGGGVAMRWGDDDVGGGVAASASLQAMVGGERSWVIPERDLEAFVVSQMVGVPGDVVASAASSAIAAVPFGGIVADGLGLDRVVRDMGYDPPTPESVGVRAGAHVDADGRGGRAGSAVAGSFGLTDVVGVAFAPATGATTVSLASALVGSLDLSALGVAPAAGVDATPMVALTVDATGRPTDLTLDLVDTDDRVVEHTRVMLDLTEPDLRSAARELVDVITGERGPRGVRPAQVALSDLVRAGVSTAVVRTSSYAIGDVDTYGIELPVGSISLTTRELTLRP